MPVTLGSQVRAATSLLGGKGFYYQGNGFGLANSTGTKQISVTANNPTTVVNVTGSSGILTFAAYGTNAYSTVHNCTMTIDGVVVLNDTQNRQMTAEGMIQVGSVYRTNAGYTSVDHGHVPFNDSLVIVMSAGEGGTYYYSYILT